ncbi:MAG: glycosyltransferase family 2 protein [Promethearchaeota archaeon]|nr:MAG: glycosyltransferase family 2 protein [Candidatus Lokiarchaeota archaeon]
MTIRESIKEEIVLKQPYQTIETSYEKKSLHKQLDNKDSFSIIIPLFNEEKTIAKIIKKIPKHRALEIIIVNDGSTDKSIENIKKLNNKKVRIIHHKNNIGYGAAILTGIEKARGDIIVTLDSDGQHDPKVIPNLIEPIMNNETDIVIGSRYLGNSSYIVPLHTRVGEFIIGKIFSLIFGKTIRNNQSGFRAFNKKTKKCIKDIKFKGMGFTTELLFKSGISNLRIKEIPIKVRKRDYGTSYVYLPRLIKSISLCIIYYSILNFINKILKYFL